MDVLRSLQELWAHAFIFSAEIFGSIWQQAVYAWEKWPVFASAGIILGSVHYIWPWFVHCIGKFDRERGGEWPEHIFSGWQFRLFS